MKKSLKYILGMFCLLILAAFTLGITFFLPYPWDLITTLIGLIVGAAAMPHWDKIESWFQE